MTAFHETLFPLDVGFGASGGPERRTEIASLSSGFEERNARWKNSRRKYDAGLGVRSLKDLEVVIRFFEERRGRLYGFRFRDPFDNASCGIGEQVSASDQVIGSGDGEQTNFSLRKTYGSDFSPYEREIAKPYADSVRVAIDGVETNDYQCDFTTGLVSLNTAPPAGAIVTAGFRFDVPVRFDTDQISFSLTAFEAGDIPSIPLVEIRL